VKNAFVLAPLVFASRFEAIHSITQAVIAFWLFCIASSAVYVFNDLCDRADDSKHPKKRTSRPLANGTVTTGQAIGLWCLFIVIVTASFIYQAQLAQILMFYIVMNIFYSLYLKYIPVIDIAIVALGFVLRVYAGAVAIAVPLSNWMAITTFALALFLAAIKRQKEIIIADQHDIQSYPYVPEWLNIIMLLSGLFTLACYMGFVFNTRQYLAITIPFVMLGLIRYGYLAHYKGWGDVPVDVLLSDSALIVVIVLWLSSVIYILKVYY